VRTELWHALLVSFWTLRLFLVALWLVCCCHTRFLTAVPGLTFRGGGGGGLGGGGGFGGWWASNPEHTTLQWASLVLFWMTLLLFSSKLKLLFWWTVFARSGGVNGLLCISNYYGMPFVVPLPLQPYLIGDSVAPAIIMVRQPY